MFGGRIAEDLFVTRHLHPAASNDYERATRMARDMVTRYGMSEAAGPDGLRRERGEVFLGRSMTKTSAISETTQQKVDAEMRRSWMSNTPWPRTSWTPIATRSRR